MYYVIVFKSDIFPYPIILFLVSPPLQRLIDHTTSRRKLYAKVCQLFVPAIPALTTAPGLTAKDVGILTNLSEELQKEFQPQRLGDLIP